MAIGKISTVSKRVEDATVNGIQASLQQKGLTRYPGTKVRIVPHKEPNGSYRTGLDPDASYIKKMSSEEAEIEIAKVTELRDIISDMYGGIDIGPRSPFFADMFSTKYMGTDLRCPLGVLKDGDNIFNLDIKEEAVVYAYLRIHPEVAPSADALLSGNYPRCSFYVNDSDVESERAYKSRATVNKAIGVLDVMSIEKRRKIARTLGLPVVESTKESIVYNTLDKYIKDTENPRSTAHAELFIKYSEMKDDNLMIMDTIKQCLVYNVLRNQGGSIYRGENMVAGSEIEAIKYYSNPKKQQEFLVLQDELKMKHSINN